MNTEKIINVEGYPIILKVTEVAEILGISRRVAYDILDRNGFPLVRIGRCKRVSRTAFFNWLEDQVALKTASN
ncbi:helix-turn-helix domain-containing protein [Paenibacillus sp. UKAQ_18]|nr:helix-turn-helix domain-containing protein [Paenibacillus sp. UKAQ_18]